MIIAKSRERFYHYKLSQPCTVVVINEYHVSTIAAGVAGRCKCKDNECADEMNQSKTYAFEIIATYIKVVTKDREFILTVLL